MQTAVSACPALCRKGGYIQRDFTAQPLKERCQQTVQLMQDIHLMMHADYFVGVAPSTALCMASCYTTSSEVCPQEPQWPQKYTQLPPSVAMWVATSPCPLDRISPVPIPNL